MNMPEKFYRSLHDKLTFRGERIAFGSDQVHNLGKSVPIGNGGGQSLQIFILAKGTRSK